MSVSDIVAVIRDGGAIGVLVMILAGGYRGWWVFGRTYDELREERDAWRTLALSAQGMTEKAVSVAETQLGARRR